MNIVKVISTKIVSNKRLIKFLRFGKSDVQENNEVGPFGFDSNPIKDMAAVYAKTSQNGESVIIGYINKNQISDIGESRIFSTDAEGLLKFYLHLKNDGTAEFGGDTDFMVRFSKLEEAFDEIKMDLNNVINVFNAHTHPTAPTGPISIPTGAGIPLQPSVADISPAKIEEIKTL